MQALILAGGRGLRLRPLTDLYAPPLLYLPGGTLIDYVLAHLQRLPIRQTGVVLNYEGEQVAWHLAHQPSLHFIPQQFPYTLLGALASAADWVYEPTFVVHVNSYFATPLHYFTNPFLHTASGAANAMFLVNRAVRRPGRLDQLAQASAYILPPEAFKLAARLANEDSLLPLISELVARGTEMMSIPLRGQQFTVRTANDLLALNRFLLSAWHTAAHPVSADPGYNPMELSWVAPDAELDDKGVGFYVTVGEGATIRDSRLQNCLVFPGVEIEGADVQDAILTDSTHTLMRIYAPPLVHA